MQSIVKLRESDPHDSFAIAPDIVPAAWADKVLADIARDTGGDARDQPSSAKSGAAADASAPNADMNFRATPINDIHAPDIQIPNVEIPAERPAALPPTGSRTRSAIIAFAFALCSAAAATGWHHYGAAAKQLIAAWTPPFALTSSPTQPTGLAAQADTPADPASSVQAAAADQAPPPSAQAQALEAAAPTAPAADAAQLQSMARDLAAMGQEIELLKATVAELKSSQQPIQQSLARDAARPSAAKTSELKPSVAAVPNPRPKVSVPPAPRAAAAPPRRPGQPYPVQAYSTQGYSTQGYPAQAYPARPYPPAQAAAPPSQQLAPPSPQPAPPPAVAQTEDGPMIRPPMPLQ